MQLTQLFSLFLAVQATHCAIQGSMCGPGRPSHYVHPHTGVEFWSEACQMKQCCSQAGFCGNGSDYCSVPDNCLQAFGTCDNDAWPPGPKIHDEPWARFHDKSVPDVITKCSKPKTLALTYDDGPSDYTQRLLNVLKSHNAKATFFVAGNTKGRMITDEPWASIIRQAYKSGHQIGSHTWSHPNLSTIDSQEIHTEFLKNEIAIQELLGRTPRYARAPYVSCDEACHSNMDALGLQLVEYQYDSGD